MYYFDGSAGWRQSFEMCICVGINFCSVGARLSSVSDFIQKKDAIQRPFLFGACGRTRRAGQTCYFMILYAFLHCSVYFSELFIPC